MEKTLLQNDIFYRYDTRVWLLKIIWARFAKQFYRERQNKFETVYQISGKEEAGRRPADKQKETEVFEEGGGLPKAGLHTKRDTNFGEKRQEFYRREEACRRQAVKPKETKVFEVGGGLPKAGLQTKRDTRRD